MQLFPVDSVERSVELSCGFVWGAFANGDRGPQAPSNFSNFIFPAITLLCFNSISIVIYNACQHHNGLLYAGEDHLVVQRCHSDGSDEFHSIDPSLGIPRHV